MRISSVIKWLVFVTIASGFFLFPGTLLSLLYQLFLVVEWLFVVMLAIAAGLYLYLKISKKPIESLGFRVVHDGGVKSIWVGSKGQGVPLVITQTTSGTKVAWAGQNYVFIIIAMAMFGPGLLALYLSYPERFNLNIPHPMFGLALLLWGVAWVVLANTLYRYFYKRPYLIISGAAVEFWEGRNRKKILYKHENVAFCLTEITYRDSDGHAAQNYMLIAQTAEKERIGLCITDKKSQIEQLLDMLRNKGFTIS